MRPKSGAGLMAAPIWPEGGKLLEVFLRALTESREPFSLFHHSLFI